MLCPSCGKSVGESLRLCDDCAAQQTAREEAQEALEQSAVQASAQGEPGLGGGQERRQSDALNSESSEADAANEDSALGGLDEETRQLLIKALGVGLAVLIALLFLLLLLS